MTKYYNNRTHISFGAGFREDDSRPPHDSELFHVRWRDHDVNGL